MPPKHLFPYLNMLHSHAMPDEINPRKTRKTSFLPLPADYVMAGPNGGGSSVPKEDIEESRDESGLGSGAGADPLKDPAADDPARALEEEKADHNDDGANDNRNPEEDWGDIGAGMG